VGGYDSWLTATAAPYRRDRPWGAAHTPLPQRPQGPTPDTPGGSPLELRQYLDIVKRHKWFIIEVVAAVGLAAGILSSLRTPVYRATASVLLTPNDPTQQLNPTSGNGVVGNDPDRYVTGQVSIAGSKRVASEAAKALPGISVEELEDMVSVSQGMRSNVINISATSSDPAEARDAADAVAKGYIENRRLVAVSGLQGAADDIEGRLGPLQTQIALLDSQIGTGSTVPGATSQLVGPVNPGAAVAPSQPSPPAANPTPGNGGAPTTQEALKAARYAAAVQYETLYSRQQELLVDISLKRGDAELIADAATPATPVSPRPGRDAALGVFGGIVLGVGLTLVREKLNDKIRSAEEVEQLTGLAVLAQLPYDEHAAETGVSIDRRPNSPLSEAMRSLRTSIQYQGVDNPVKVIVVTSALPGEGKSLVATNLATAFAQADYRVILVSADLRRPSINGLFGDLGRSSGLIGVLSPTTPNGSGPAANGHANGHSNRAMELRTVEALRKTPVSGLLLLPSGPVPPNPAELLGSQRMATLLTHLSATADLIIIDSPPLLPVTDAAVLAAKCDGIVLVTAANETPRGAIERCKAILDGTGARVLGAVVNKASKKGDGYYHYGPYYGEGTKDAEQHKSGVAVNG
jgi:Mrp family chromosome partitioning ATPase/capsular polysaccharide biosynthesis protein